MKEAIEQRIRDLLAEEVITSQALSNALFGPMGLFNKLATTEQERWALIKTPLFQDAQERVTELQLAEHEDYQRRLERRCKACAARAAAAGSPPPANGPANGAPADQPARTDTPT